MTGESLKEKEKARIAQSERDEYKFLLNNIREQVIELKRENGEEINRIIKKKDEEIVLSNKDILEANGSLMSENSILKGELKKHRDLYE
jgi:hypothetical protein